MILHKIFDDDLKCLIYSRNMKKIKLKIVKAMKFTSKKHV